MTQTRTKPKWLKQFSVETYIKHDWNWLSSWVLLHEDGERDRHKTNMQISKTFSKNKICWCKPKITDYRW